MKERGSSPRRCSSTIGAALGAALILLAGLPDVSAAHQHHNAGGHRRFGHHRPHATRGVIVVPLVYSPPTPTVVYTPPPVYYYPPPVYYYYPPPQSYAPPQTYAPPAPTASPPASQDVQPIPREVVFPTGRWVLQGDGVAVPYTWAWIPNPPTAPPVAAGAPSGRVEERPIYAWTDANGVTTYTDRLSKVPPEHRANARRDP